MCTIEACRPPPHERQVHTQSVHGAMQVFMSRRSNTEEQWRYSDSSSKKVGTGRHPWRKNMGVCMHPSG